MSPHPINVGVAKVGLAFGMNVVAWSQNSTSDARTTGLIAAAPPSREFRPAEELQLQCWAGDASPSHSKPSREAERES